MGKLVEVVLENVNVYHPGLLFLAEIICKLDYLKEACLSVNSDGMVHMSLMFQKQIDLVRTVCDAAEKLLGEARKVYGLSSRQGPVALTTLDKAQAARIAEQEKLLRAASNHGEGVS